MFVEVLYGACQVVSEPSLVFLICHLRADEQMPKVSENFIKEYLYVKKMSLSLIKKNNNSSHLCQAFAKHHFVGANLDHSIHVSGYIGRRGCHCPHFTDVGTSAVRGGQRWGQGPRAARGLSPFPLYHALLQIRQRPMSMDFRGGVPRPAGRTDSNTARGGHGLRPVVSMRNTYDA